MSKQASWYFDFVSPFSYLALAQFDRLPVDLELRFVPVLFAGLLKHFGHKGPAEIPLKRVHTYRYCRWYAARHQIGFVMPPAHPFNPLPLLRECIRHGSTRGVVETLFRGVFEQGLSPADERFWSWCASESGLALSARTDHDDTVKAALRDATARAAEAGIYGVPAFACNGEVFWGVDTMDLFIEFLADPLPFQDTESRRLATLPVEATRRF